MTKKLTHEQAVDFGHMVSRINNVDFQNGEGKVLVFNNAVLIMQKADEDDREGVSAQLVINNYERFDIDVETGGGLEDFLRDMFGE